MAGRRVPVAPDDVRAVRSDHVPLAGRPQRLPTRITISTLDRLILPDLLDDIDRVVYVDIDTLVLGDICRLAATDLAGRPIAARDSTAATQGWQAPRGHSPRPATDVRRGMAHRHGFGDTALNAGVLVLDLDRMRADRFTATYLPLVEQYGLHDQDVMLAYVGGTAATSTRAGTRCRSSRTSSTQGSSTGRRSASRGIRP